jgi:DNA polymerase-1
MKEKLYIIDGYGMIYKSYFAFLRSPLTNSKGQNVSALIGFFKTFFSLIQREDPKYLVVAMDAPWPTFRHDLYSEYKANREDTPQELRAQIEPIKELLQAMGVCVYEKKGFEADDIMGTLALEAKDNQWEAYILSADKDLLQMVQPGIKILRPSKGQIMVMDEEAVMADKGIRADQMIDYLALIGDSSDNIPGVAGIGPKTAVKLLSDYNDLQGIYDNLDSIKSTSQRSKLLDNKEMAFFSKKLVTIECKVPMDVHIQDSLMKAPLDQRIIEIAEQWQLNSLVKDFAKTFKREEIQVTQQQEKSLDSYQTSKVKYSLIQSEEQLIHWLKMASNALVLSLDTETDSTDSMKAQLAGISLSVKPAEACYIPVRAPQGEKVIDESILRKHLINFFKNTNSRLVGQNIKYDKKVLIRWGLDIGPIYFDTMVAAWV